ncbi:hypothetical protein [Aquipseudomonas campi]
MQSINILSPEPEEVQVNDQTVKVYPVRLKHFELYGAAAGDLLAVIGASTVEQVHAYGQRNSKKLAKVLASTTSLSSWRARRLPAAVIIQLMLHVIRVNAGFFVRAQVGAAAALAGLVSSSA